MKLTVKIWFASMTHDDTSEPGACASTAALKVLKTASRRPPSSSTWLRKKPRTKSSSASPSWLMSVWMLSASRL